MNTKILSMTLELWDFTVLFLTAQAPYDRGWGIHPMWGWGMGMMFVMCIFWTIVIVALVFGIRWFMAQRPRARSDAALEILRRRFARGEIEKDEFDAKRKALS
jgi:putative membrane protein